MQTHPVEVPVTFGDCDPAAVVFHPNIFRWFDFAFHDWLRQFGGHAELCRTLDAIGIGLVEVGAAFLLPVHAGDLLRIEMTISRWARRTIRIEYEGSVAGTAVLTGHEVRAIFLETGNGIVAGATEPLHRLVSAS